jgi:hypothetical protein
MTCSDAFPNTLDDYSFRKLTDTHTQENAEVHVEAVPAAVKAVKKESPVPAKLPSKTAPPAQVAPQPQAQKQRLPTESLLPSSNAPISNNAFASSANMNGAQVMTGRSSSRVLAPPGGHTSWTLG